MNSRKLFLNIFNSEKNGRTLNWELAYWIDAIQRWYKEGLPEKNEMLLKKIRDSHGGAIGGEAIAIAGGINDKDVHDFFGFDEGIKAINLNVDIIPNYEEEIYEEDEVNITMRRGDGKVVKTRKDGTYIPFFIEYPIKTKNDFNKFKRRYDTNLCKRLPKNWSELIKEYKNRTYPLQLGGLYGFFSIIRELMGPINGMTAFYDNPK